MAARDNFLYFNSMGEWHNHCHFLNSSVTELREHFCEICCMLLQSDLPPPLLDQKFEELLLNGCTYILNNVLWPLVNKRTIPTDSTTAADEVSAEL
jgi:hypothetical protein